MEEEIRKVKNPEEIKSYFWMEKWTLAVIAVSGCIYNVGMTAGPWFEGMLAQYLYDIIGKRKGFSDMVILALGYVLTIFIVQFMRYIKRLYVRKFANNINRDMKHVLYHSLVHKEKKEFETERTGAVMTKAISDVDACVEGMRKFTTEVFDTGVVMAAYFVMLLFYDWRLTLLSMVFPPMAYVIAKHLKKQVSVSVTAYKASADRLNETTLDRISNAVTYRVYGQEKNRNEAYETSLTDYEKKAVKANIWENALQPVYKIISMLGVLVILWFGGKNVMGNGWSTWDIGAFTTFLSCFTKLAAKSSKAAKLFNAVQKARVSWQRIKPFMKEIEEEKTEKSAGKGEVKAENLSFAYPGGKAIFENLNFTVKPGEMIGITGPVACGKSTFGRIFLCEYPYEGSLSFEGKELSELKKSGFHIVSYMGHQPELLSDTIKENVLLGDEDEVNRYLQAVCMDREMKEMPDGMETKIGNKGTRLSGGQQARIALARTLCHRKPILVLDDPFSAVDKKTEVQIMENIKEMGKDSVIFLISHRLTLFPELNRVFWMEDGKITVSDHEHLMKEHPKYADLYRRQTEEVDGNEA